MRIAFVYWGYENAGSMLDLRGYTRAAKAMGHEVIVYGPKEWAFALDYSKDLAGVDGLAAELAPLVRLEHRHVDGKKEIAAFAGEAVAGIENQGDVVLFERVIERLQRLVERIAGEIVGGRHLEAQVGKRLRHGVRVGDGLLQGRQRLVGVVADDKRATLAGAGAGGLDGRQRFELRPERVE